MDPSADRSVLGALAQARRITIAGDWHGDATWARRVIERAKTDGAPRVIVQLGDFGVWPGRDGQRYLDAVANALEAADALCMFLDGNHEDFPQLLGYPLDERGLRTVRPRLFHLARGARWTWRGLRFLAVGGATSLDRTWRTPNVDWWPDEELTQLDIDHAVQGGTCDVMVTHDAPTGVDVPGLPPRSSWAEDELLRAYKHRQRLRDVVEAVRPQALFHGHFHSRYDGRLRLHDGHTVAVTGLSNERTGSNNFIDVDATTLARGASLAER